MGQVNFFWFRRDLRCHDNAGLYHALKSGAPVLPVFIFDTDILGKLDDPQDARVQFIYDRVAELKEELQEKGGDRLVRYGRPLICNPTRMSFTKKTTLSSKKGSPAWYERSGLSKIEPRFSIAGVETNYAQTRPYFRIFCLSAQAERF